MITANKGSVKIEGTNLDLIFEFNSIIDILSESNPEIVLGAITAWSDALAEKLKSASKIELAIVTHMSEDFMKIDRESEDDDD